MSEKVILVSDSHVSVDDYDTDFRRFKALGNYLLEEKPDRFVHIGDVCNLDSCTTYELPENRPILSDEVEATKRALELTFTPLLEYYLQRKRNRHKYTRVVCDLVQGNHCARLHKEIKRQSVTLGSVIDPDELFGYHDWFDTITAYGEYLLVKDIGFTHAPLNKVGKPLTNIYRGRSIAMQSDYNIIYGHSHSMDFTTVPLTPVAGNALRWTFNAPAFLEQNHVERYATGSMTGWTYGLIKMELDDVNPIPRFEYVPMNTVMDYL